MIKTIPGIEIGTSYLECMAGSCMALRYEEIGEICAHMYNVEIFRCKGIGGKRQRRGKWGTIGAIETK